MEKRIPVAVLGATGTVGQRFISLLADHPWFEVYVVTGSARSAGRRYGEAVRWVLPESIPDDVQDLEVRSSAEELGPVELVFSALPSAIARDLETELAAKGYPVCSNASAHRMAADVPLLIPEINLEHLGLVEQQRDQRGWPGMLVTSPNCATTGMVFPLKALHDAFGLRRAHVVTMQAISGAGFPGVAAYDIQDNIIPYIKGEEEKLEAEPRKLLGDLDERGWVPAEFQVSAQVHRVPVLEGHLAALSVELERKASPEGAAQALADFQGPPEVRALPSAPVRPMVVRTEPDRPQPGRDRDAGAGMVISVGRVQACNALDIRLVSLVHNTLRGAASGAILNAEALVAGGYLKQFASVTERVGGQSRSDLQPHPSGTAR